MNKIRQLRAALTTMILALLTACGNSDSPSQSADFLIDPENDFEEFWLTFQQNYTFFDKRGIDWQQQFNVYRPAVTQSTSGSELFTILSEMVAPLKDGHVTISKSDSKFAADEGVIYIDQQFTRDEFEELLLVSAEALKRDGFGELQTAGQLMQYATSDKFGYLRVIAFEGESLATTNSNLNQVMTSFNDLAGVIIDIRSNRGGFDDTAFAIANRFADEQRLAHTKTTQLAPGEFSASSEHYLTPIDGEAYAKPVVLLTNDATASAAEVMALIMKQLPHVTLVGDRTQGIFSDTMVNRLSNGWVYALSNQRYFSPEGFCYEAMGVPVDVPVLNAFDDLESGFDPVIETALSILKEQIN